MKLSINKNIINKNDTKANQAKGFESLDLTVNELAECINQGFAFSYQFHSNYRNTSNFICSDIIAADIDDGMTIEEALADDFITKNASIIYTTPSHTTEKPRFRIVFQLPHTVTDKDLIKFAQTGLTRKFPADAKAIDSSRQFYGSKGSNPNVIGNILTEEKFIELIKLGEIEIFTDSVSSASSVAGSRSILTLEEDIRVKTSDNVFKSLIDLPPSTAIFCPFHSDRSPSAFTTFSKLGVLGIHCSSCNQTFWTKDNLPPPYNFFEFDHWVKTRLLADMEDESGLVTYNSTSQNIILDQRYLSGLELLQGTTYIKSPKGTGKTQYLKKIVKELKTQNKSILLVGHRRNLLRSMSSELGLECYLDVVDGPQVKRSQHFAISVDSIGKYLEPARDKFHAVLIDESEQVFSHIISNMLSMETRRKSYMLLKHYIRRANFAIALDADLNTVSMSAMEGFGNSNPLADVHLILNEYKTESNAIELYESENHLISDLMQSLKNNQRLFVCCNSKKKVDRIVEYITKEFGDAFPWFCITGDNSDFPEVIDFVRDIKKQILKYNIVLASPALGTGTDITFPEGESLIDGVYGFFDARINTHHDIDQQLSRVRSPKSIKVWISPEKFDFETETDPIKQELAKSDAFSSNIQGYSRSGIPEYNWDEEYFNLHATILSSQRASKNNLKDHFIALKKYNGWQIDLVEKDKNLASEGNKILKEGESLREENYIKGVLNAKVCDGKTLDILQGKEKQGSLTESEKFILIRTNIEYFYDEPITAELINLDDEGKYRNQIKLLKGVLSVAPRKKDPRSTLLKKVFVSANLFYDENNLDVNVKITNETLVKFVEFCINNKPAINRLLNLEVRRDIFKKSIAQLNTFLRLCSLEVNVSETRNSGKTKIYSYQLDSIKLDFALKLIEKQNKVMKQYRQH